MRLRPHHMMCVQGFSGKGYNQAFIDQMNRLTSILKTGEPHFITITFGCDDICLYCPNQIQTGICSEQQKVNDIDRKMIHYFHIEEKTYEYHQLLAHIKATITEEMMNHICSRCEWYPISACKEKMLELS